jgi:hypothetical protein
VDWFLAVLILAAILLAAALLYFAFRLWNGRSDRANESGVDFHPNIGFARQDGYKSIAVLLFNKSDVPVWTEEIEIVLTELVANQQAAAASCHEIHKIRQAVPARDMLPISLVEAIYNAAGRPQLRYSCVMSSLVRYRIGERWFEEPMKVYRLKMAGLTVSGVRQDRKAGHTFQLRQTPNDLAGIANREEKFALDSKERR